MSQARPEAARLIRDLMEACWSVGVNPLTLMAEELTALGWQVTPPSPDWSRFGLVDREPDG
jgi:hypothetical protein